MKLKLRRWKFPPTARRFPAESRKSAEQLRVENSQQEKEPGTLKYLKAMISFRHDMLRSKHIGFESWSLESRVNTNETRNSKPCLEFSHQSHHPPNDAKISPTYGTRGVSFIFCF